MSLLNLHWRQWLRIPRWVAEPRYFWLFVAGLLVASVLGDWLGCWWNDAAIRQDKIRYSGWLLDALGLLSISIGISSKLDRFQDKNLIEYAGEHLFAYFRRFPLLTQNKVVHVGTANLELSTPTLRAYGTVRIDPNKPLDEKVDWLLEQHYTLVETIHGTMREVHAKTSDLAARIDATESVLESELTAMQQDSADFHTGGIGLEIVGLLWIFAGITLATVPEFIESAFSWLIKPLEILPCT